MIATQTDPRIELRKKYEAAAWDLINNQTMEDLVESTPQATQRSITLAALGQIKSDRADVHPFNDLLIMYPLPGTSELGWVAPDNMVVVFDGPVEVESNFSLVLEESKPFWVIEYVSKDSAIKDYVVNREKYEKRVKVPYYMIFDPKVQELVLLRLNARGKYANVKPNAAGRLPIPSLDLELGIAGEFVRYWYKGKLLPTAEEFHQALSASEEKRRDAEEKRRDAEEKRRDAEEKRRDAEEKNRKLIERLRQLGETVD